jgi:hypothetical protein
MVKTEVVEMTVVDACSPLRSRLMLVPPITMQCNKRFGTVFEVTSGQT